MTDLWGDLSIEETKFDESKAIELLREQARLLDKKTNGKVKATFSKIDYKKTAVDLIGTISSFMPQTEEILEKDLEGKVNINEIYNYTKYKFELYNDTYRFRAFILYFRPIFPLEIEVDEGIKEELKLEAKETINNDEDLKSIITSVFSSNKLQLIIKKLVTK